MSALVLREGAVRIQIHRVTSKGYTSWQFRWRDAAGRMERVCRASRADIEREARQRLQLAAQRDVKLSHEEARRYAEFLKLEVRARAAGFSGMDEALTVAARHRPATVTTKTLPELVAEMIAARQARGASELHLKDLRSRLGRLAREVNVPLAGLTPELLQTWLYDLKVEPRTRLNYYGALENFLTWCVAKKHLPPGNRLEGVEKPMVPKAAVSLFSVDDMRWILRHAPSAVLPAFLLGGFAGLRNSETQLLDWSHVHFEEGLIEVPQAGKTGRRLVPLLDNLRAWLTPMKGVGRIVPMGTSGISKAIVRCVRSIRAAQIAAGQPPRFRWENNALRHSFASYRVAETKNLAAVSHETGHSVAMLRKHYLEIVTPSAARDWFGLMPEVRRPVAQLSLFSGQSPG